MSDKDETRPESPKFDFSAFPADTLFYDRRDGLERRDRPVERPPVGRPSRSRRNRCPNVGPARSVDDGSTRRPSRSSTRDDEIEFMNAVQQFKTQTGKSFPSHGDILRIAARLGYRKGFPIDDFDEEDSPSREIETAVPI